MPPKNSKKRPSSKKRSQNQYLATPMIRLDKMRDANLLASKSTRKSPSVGPPTAPKPPQNGFFIWGRHAVLAALKNNERRIAQIYAVAEVKSELTEYVDLLNTNRRKELTAIQTIDRSRLDCIGGTQDKAVHQGMALAVWRLDTPHLEDFLAINNNKNLRILLLDQLSDPRNVGAILRSARAFGVAGVITTFRNAAEESGALARAASGALDHVPYLRVVNLARAIEQLQDAGITVAGLAADGAMNVSELSKFNRLAIVLGAEGDGLRRLSREHCDHLVHIEIIGLADSLNVSNAAAIALYAASAEKC